MPINFNCPACSAPMEYDGESTLFQNCKTCGAPIVIPTEVVDESRANKSSQTTGEPPKPDQTNDPKVIANAKILEAVGAGDKIHAIKIHRDTFGTDLKTSKEAIEKLAFDLGNARPAAIRQSASNISEDEMNSVGVKIMESIKAGCKIEAIKLFRESFNSSLEKAKDAIEALERGETINPSNYS